MNGLDRKTPESEKQAPLGPIVVSEHPKRKKAGPKKVVEKPKNVFDDQTARWLLRLIKGKKETPKVVLPNAAPPKPTEPRDAQEELAEAIRDSLRPWFLSVLFHAVILLALALCFFPRLDNDDLTIISGIGDELTKFVFDKNLGLSDERIDRPIIVKIDLPEVADPMADVPRIEKADIGPEVATSETASTLPPGLSPDGRELGRRADMLANGGGNGDTEKAVIAGLRWLVKVQQRDGSWSLSRDFPHGAAKEQDDPIAATAMALLAFQGFGATPSSQDQMFAEFTLPLTRGWDWLRRRQEPNGCFFSKGAHVNNRFYTHALCTIAICELYAMTKDETLRESAQKAIDYCVKTQNLAGGWRYVPDRFSYDADVSVTGWIVMALKSGQGAGLEVSEKTFEKISTFLDATSREHGSQSVYRDIRGQVPRPSMSAEALLCRELLGWKRDDARLARGIENLVTNHPISFTEPEKRDVYYWYYATQAIHHYGGEQWRLWNERMREELPKHQEKNGSWHPQQPQSDEWWYYGRLYTTCFSIYILEVYYRHLTIYQCFVQTKGAFRHCAALHSGFCFYGTCCNSRNGTQRNDGSFGL